MGRNPITQPNENPYYTTKWESVIYIYICLLYEVDYEMLMRSFWGAYEVLMKSLWSVYEVLMKCLWGAYEVLIMSLWSAYEVLMRSLWSAYALLMKCLWDVYEVLMGCLWSAYEVFYEMLMKRRLWLWIGGHKKNQGTSVSSRPCPREVVICDDFPIIDTGPQWEESKKEKKHFIIFPHPHKTPSESKKI